MSKILKIMLNKVQTPYFQTYFYTGSLNHLLFGGLRQVAGSAFMVKICRGYTSTDMASPAEMN